MTAIQILGIFLLIGANAFFAASEFSLVAVRLSRIRQLVQEGDPRAKLVESLLSDIGRVVSGVQVGMTIASLSLGYLGEVTLVSILQPFVNEMTPRWATIVEHSAAVVIVFGLLTILQVVFGELVPKALSLARAERVALLIARPFYWFVHTFRWAIDFLDGFSEKVVGALGILSPQSHTLVRSIEELQVMIQQVRDLGLLPASEAKFVQNALELRQVQVREIMVPRPDIHALPIDATIDDTMQMFATTQRSRIPVYEGSIDHVLGFVHLKDVMWTLLDHTRTHDGEAANFHLTNFLREVAIVPETKPASELLRELLARHIGMAMIVDEFGSILGLATLEDILEQMIGEIHDEFDVVERPLTLADGSMIFDGATNVRDLEVQHNIVVPEDPSYSTVAGFVLARLGFIPRGGESFDEGGYRYTVMDMDRRRVSRVKIKRLQPPAETSPGGTGPSGESLTPSPSPACAAAEENKAQAAAIRVPRER